MRSATRSKNGSPRRLGVLTGEERIESQFVRRKDAIVCQPTMPMVLQPVFQFRHEARRIKHARSDGAGLVHERREHVGRIPQDGLLRATVALRPVGPDAAHFKSGRRPVASHGFAAYNTHEHKYD